MNKKIATIDFGIILFITNIIIIISTYIAYFFSNEYQYINWITIFLSTILGLQTIAILFYEKGRRNPFVIIVAYIVTVFYSFRIFTLTIFEWSNVFSRYSYSVDDTNYALVYIIIANIFLYGGLIYQKKPPFNSGAIEKKPESHALYYIILLSVLTLFDYTKKYYWNEGNIPSGLNFLLIILSSKVLILLSIAYLLKYKNYIRKIFIYLIIVLILLETVLNTISGSRSAILVVFNDLLITLLALHNCVQISRKIFIRFLCASPLIIALLFGSFGAATYIRENNNGANSLELSQAIQTISNINTPSMGNDLLAKTFDRIGYFDYSAEIIANREYYSEIFNLEFYAKSIVDNILTPGLDFFDQPRVENALMFIYGNLGTPSKIATYENYHSDQLGIYGEFHNLFGLFSFPILFVVALVFRKIFLGITGSEFSDLLKKIFILHIFFIAFNSFGLDWVLTEAIVLLLAFYIYERIGRSFRYG